MKPHSWGFVQETTRGDYLWECGTCEGLHLKEESGIPDPHAPAHTGYGKYGDCDEAIAMMAVAEILVG